MKPLLLHACCAPCSLEPVRLLREEGFEPTICWTNPNIQPLDEWQRRLDELRRWCTEGDIELIEAGEDRDRWERAVAPLAADRPRRCRACYGLRLAEACRVAEDRGFEFIGTTLAVSPYQLFETCNDVLERLAAARGLTRITRRRRVGRASSACTGRTIAAADSPPSRPPWTAPASATSARRRVIVDDRARWCSTMLKRDFINLACGLGSVVREFST